MEVYGETGSIEKQKCGLRERWIRQKTDRAREALVKLMGVVIGRERKVNAFKD